MKRLFALLLVLAACATPRLPPREPKEAAEPPATEVRRVYYPGGKQLKKRYVVLVDPSGGAEKHGREEEWHADGERKAERTFEHGAPSGTWRTWYDGGAVESVVEIGDGTELLPMRWWYADGTPRAEGQGRGGVREGAWTYYHPNGKLSERGSFAGGRREGLWVTFDATGRRRAEGEYQAGMRVGRWLLWDERGILHEKQSDAPSGSAEELPPGDIPP